MNFTVVQRYRSDADAVQRAYADPELYPRLVGLPKLGGIELVEHRSASTGSDLRVRFRFTGDLPAAATAVVDPDRLTWVQESHHDLDGGTTTFRLLPDYYADRLEASGRYRVSARAAGGSTREVRGTLKVRALLVASKVESAIVEGLREYLEAEAPVVDRWIEQR